jgi:hypothetical protein
MIQYLQFSACRLDVTLKYRDNIIDLYVLLCHDLTRDLWNTRPEIRTQTKLVQPSWKNGQHQTPETGPQLQTPRKKKSWTPQETMASRRCRNRSKDLVHGGRWWWCHITFPKRANFCYENLHNYYFHAFRYSSHLNNFKRKWMVSIL